MRRESAEVAAAAQRRLELLGRELGRDREAEDAEHTENAEVPPVLPVLVPDPGRHARSGRETWSERTGARLTEGLPERLTERLRARIALGPAHLGLVALVVAVALAVTAWTVLRGAPSATPVPVAHTSKPSVAPGSPAPETPSVTASPGSAEVVVDVAGKVLHPGVATLPAGSRVIDAIRHAGGARPGVDLSGLNLARKLGDGEQVLVGRPAGRAAGAVASPAPGSDSSSGATVNLNTASLEQLEGLPGVGPVTAQKILDWRTEHGSFSTVDELLEVAGIGEKTMADIAPHATV